MSLMNRSRRDRINFASRVIKWGRQSANRYPWRNTSDPYAILIAELMLRKTTRRQVEKVFAKFLRRFPDPCSLSRARVRDIRSEIRSLGLESVRAQGLSKIAKVLMAKYEGRVPDDRESLLDLSHVGPYIANAVLCMAYDQQLPLVDTNTIRVVRRAFSIQSVRKRDRTDVDVCSFPHSAQKGQAIQFGHVRSCSYPVSPYQPKMRRMSSTRFMRLRETKCAIYELIRIQMTILT